MNLTEREMEQRLGLDGPRAGAVSGQQAPVFQALSALQNTVMRLSDDLAQVRCRLEPVLEREPPPPNKAVPADRVREAGVCDMQDSLLEAADRLRTLESQVEDILRRLAI